MMEAIYMPVNLQEVTGLTSHLDHHDETKPCLNLPLQHLRDSISSIPVFTAWTTTLNPTKSRMRSGPRDPDNAKQGESILSMDIFGGCLTRW